MSDKLHIPWPKLPFVRLLLPFALGILLQKSASFDLGTIITLFLFSSLLFAFSEFKYISFGKRWVRGILLNITFLLLGCTAWSVRTVDANYAHFTHFSSKGTAHYVQLLEVPVEKSKSYKVEVEVDGVALGKLKQHTKGKALLYLQKDSSVALLQPGDLLRINADLRPVEQPGNPGQFDYGGFLRNRGIHRTAYARTEDWTKYGQGHTDLMGLIRRLRSALLVLLNTGELNGEEGQIASALLLGYKEDLDPELRQAFVQAGAMHVLAVSGLHVGIVFMALSFLLKWVERFPKGKVVKVILVIGLIWVYALLSGSSPSVIRASVMFSMIGLAGVFQRQANIYNTLAASAFVMLMFEPRLLFEVGFQLSYSAVLGIVAIFPTLRGLLSSEFWLLNKIWDLTAVSIAAQLGTLPLSLYYFHQMPTYSFLSNLIVIPAAFVVISVGGLYLILFWIKPLTFVLSKILWAALWTTNSSMKWIGALPASVVQFPAIGTIEVIVIYGIIIGVLVSLIHKNKPALTFALLCSALLISIFIAKDHTALKQNKIIVFDQRNGILLAHIKGNEIIVYADSIALSDVYTQRTIDDAARHFRVKNVADVLIDIDGVAQGLAIDHGTGRFIIALGNTELEHSRLMEYEDLLVLPSSIKSWRLDKMVEELALLGKPNYSIERNGALVLDLNDMEWIEDP